MNMFSKAHDQHDHLLELRFTCECGDVVVALNLAGHEINAIPAHGAGCAHGQELSHVASNNQHSLYSDSAIQSSPYRLRSDEKRVNRSQPSILSRDYYRWQES